MIDTPHHQHFPKPPYPHQPCPLLQLQLHPPAAHSISPQNRSTPSLLQWGVRVKILSGGVDKQRLEKAKALLHNNNNNTEHPHLALEASAVVIENPRAIPLQPNTISNINIKIS